ncbi:MAG: peptidoglycan-binding protein LysM [Pseudonocardiales bacterium]|nr:MAG: peptidoglycan-binding protein LysM [Pseudonocardiales bacterium]
MRHLKALGAMLVLLILVVGIPLGMAATIGNPLHGWADLKVGDLTDAVLIDLLAVIVWLAWAQFAVSVLVEVGAAARHVQIPTRIPLVPGASQHLAHTLVGAALLLGTATAALASPVHALAAAPAHSVAAVASVHAQSPSPSTRPPNASAQQSTALSRHQTRTATRPQTVTYVIPSDGSGPDTYWDIAEAHLGDGDHWQQIWDLNRGRSQPDGEVMNNPGLLKPGWTVLLPETGAPTPHGGTQLKDVTVHEGDTLSGIAASHSVADWHQAWQASKGMAEPGGQHLTNPDLIRPGWTVKIPVANGTTTTATTTTPTEHPSKPQTPSRHPSTSQTPTQQPPKVPFKPPPGQQTPGQQAPAPSNSAAPTTPRPEQQHDSPAASRPARGSSEASMVAFAGGGVLLAGVSLAALIRYRRRQRRWRHPGRTISATPPGLQRVERALLSSGNAGIADVTWLNEALRSLVHSLAATEAGRLPDVVAARMTTEALELVLTAAQPEAPKPWRVDETGTRWSIERSDDLGYDPASRAYHFAPFPTLASVGYTAAGEHWLLDLERVAAMSLSGDPERCLNLARFLAAELAHNAWSEMLQVTLVGFGQEMAEINPERLTYTEDFAKAIASLSGDLASTSDALHHSDVDVLAGRLHNIAGDAWAPHVLLIAPSAAEDTEGLEQLLTAMRAQRSRTAVALVLADDPDHTEGTRWQLTIDEHGTLRIPALDVELIAQQIPAEEAAQLAQMLALAATVEDRPVPDADGDKPWDEYTDAAGSLRHSLAAPAAPAPTPASNHRSAGHGIADIPALHLAESAPWVRNSLLPLSPQTYLDQTATTAQDLQTLAPHIDEATRAQVESIDPELDRDLADWYDPACTRPKVRLLGAVSVRAQGSLPPRNPRVLWNTEIVAYFATRSCGVSVETFATDMWPDDPDIARKTKPRQSVSVVRTWLGVSQRTGQEHIPKGTTALACPYRLEDALVDAELFRRLRLRGSARGAAGIADLRAALDLVEGVPFSGRRPEGYGWLAENPLDHVYAGMIVDVAHIVATHHLAAGEPELAVSAAQVALKADSSEDVPLLDLVAACDAQDNRAEADIYIKRILANHDAEVEEDLPPRTAEILHRRQWLGQPS